MKLKLKEELGYEEGKVAHKVIAKSPSGIVILMTFDKDTYIDTHSAPAVALVQILEGVCAFTLQGEEMMLKEGDYLVMEPGMEHSLRAPERFKMLLTKLNA